MEESTVKTTSWLLLCLMFLATAGVALAAEQETPLPTPEPNADAAALIPAADTGSCDATPNAAQSLQLVPEPTFMASCPSYCLQQKIACVNACNGNSVCKQQCGIDYVDCCGY